MASITEHLIKLQELTQRNLDILQALNDSFFTNQNHLSVKVGENQYAIPSFIALENKINSLTANFENLVNAPESGEAFFDFNGNTRAIQVRSYTSVPNSLVLEPIKKFDVEKNDIFKDFLTPNPFIKFNVATLPNDTTQVIVKKIMPLSKGLKDLFASYLTETIDDTTINNVSAKKTYQEIYKVISLLEKNVDYVEYDVKADLPIRKNIGTGTYVIEKIVEDIVDDNLDNYITLQIRSDINDSTIMSSLKYRLFDETIEKMLKPGDHMVTYEGNAKMEVVEVKANTNIIKVKVLYGEFLNLVPSTNNDLTKISNLSKIKFYSPVDFDADKYVKVSLEEDQYVFVTIAALNSRMNVQSPWGSGIVINTHLLTNDKNENFKSYYNENVRNVGDVLYEITSLMSNTLMKHTEEEYKGFTTFTPTINPEYLKVTRINSHLNDSVAIQNIKSLYSQKKSLQIQLDELQSKININKEKLASISYDDLSGERTALLTELSKLNVSKSELTTAMFKLMNELAVSANNSEVPIENAKYRIRGFYDIKGNEWEDHIKGIRVQYRYRNVNEPLNKALSFDDKFVFSDWNNMSGFDRERVTEYKNGGYISNMANLNDDSNEPSFNQIDIPITQGEIVDIRLKVVYDFGYPFVQTSSAWSPIYSIEFPEEYLMDVKILDIIEENNNDIETNRFNNILTEGGIPVHIGDKLTDQDITYFHKPESIASGFYTSERRIIPLKDKLNEINNWVIQLRDEFYGTESDKLSVYIKQGSKKVVLKPNQHNIVNLEPYTHMINNPQMYDGDYTITEIKEKIQGTEYIKKLISVTLQLYLQNETDHIIKLHSMFPGDRGASLDAVTNHKFHKEDYCDVYSLGTAPSGIPFEVYEMDENGKYGSRFYVQGGNQYLYFRKASLAMGTVYYEKGNELTSQTYNKLALGYPVTGAMNTNPEVNAEYVKYGLVPEGASTTLTSPSMFMYPKLTNRYGLCLNTNTIGSNIILQPGDELIIPIVVEYYIDPTGPSASPNTAPGSDAGTGMCKTMSFDVLPSLYKDPINYEFIVNANYGGQPITLGSPVIGTEANSTTYNITL